MPSLTFKQIADFVGGSLLQGGDAVADSVIIDSREARPGAVFFAIKGDRLDGHTFLAQALEQCAGAVVSTVPESLPVGKAFIKVDDTLVALQDLARAIRKHYEFMVIGITGSAGKTTTKEMISTLVETERRTWRSRGNFNNHIGFPLSLSNMPDDTEIVVSEMGMSAKGEIEFLARMVHPEIGVYTTIKPVHLEFFGSIEGIAAAKRELLENLAPGGTVVINNDDPQVVRISADFPDRKVTYGVNTDAQYRATDVRERGLKGSSFTLVAEGENRLIELSLPGMHNLENLLAAIAAARAAGISWDGIMRGVKALQPAYHRGVAVDWKGATLYDDTYNSNPYALGRVLELLDAADCQGNRIAVIGDMLELGPQELEFHENAGRSIPKSVTHVVAVGPRSKSLLEGAKQAGFSPEALHHFDKAEAAIPMLRELIKPGDLVLLKASRGIGLDRIVTELEKEA